MLDRLLTTLDVRVEAFATCETCPGWRLSFDADPTPSIHYVLFGSGFVHVPDHPPIPVLRNSVVILPRHTAHVFENARFRGLETIYRAGGTGPDTSLPIIRAGEPVVGQDCLIMTCGAIHASLGGGLGLFDEVERPLVEAFGDHPLANRFEALVEELRVPSLGTRALAEAFLKEAVVLVLRRLVRRSGELPSWLRAIQDPVLSPAILAILTTPERPFTLEDLAAAAGLSRSAFAERFAAAFGQPPIEFLKRVRLRRAARLLDTTDLPIKVVAASVGYSSRSYFSRAFRAVHGVDPSDYRTRRILANLPPSDARVAGQ